MADHGDARPLAQHSREDVLDRLAKALDGFVAHQPGPTDRTPAEAKGDGAPGWLEALRELPDRLTAAVDSAVSRRGTSGQGRPQDPQADARQKAEADVLRSGRNLLTSAVPFAPGLAGPLAKINQLLGTFENLMGLVEAFKKFEAALGNLNWERTKPKVDESGYQVQRPGTEQAEQKTTPTFDVKPPRPGEKPAYDLAPEVPEARKVPLAPDIPRNYPAVPFRQEGATEPEPPTIPLARGDAGGLRRGLETPYGLADEAPDRAPIPVLRLGRRAPEQPWRGPSFPAGAEGPGRLPDPLGLAPDVPPVPAPKAHRGALLARTPMDEEDWHTPGKPWLHQVGKTYRLAPDVPAAPESPPAPAVPELTAAHRAWLLSGPQPEPPEPRRGPSFPAAASSLAEAPEPLGLAPETPAPRPGKTYGLAPDVPGAEEAHQGVRAIHGSGAGATERSPAGAGLPVTGSAPGWMRPSVPAPDYGGPEAVLPAPGQRAGAAGGGDGGRADDLIEALLGLTEQLKANTEERRKAGEAVPGAGSATRKAAEAPAGGRAESALGMPPDNGSSDLGHTLRQAAEIAKLAAMLA